MNEHKLTNEQRKRISKDCELILGMIYQLGNTVPDGHSVNSDVFKAYRAIEDVKREHGVKKTS